MIQEIRKRLEERPFKSFVLRLDDGRELPVPRPESIWLPPPDIMMVWNDDEDTAERVKISSITEVDIPGKKPRARKERRRK